MAKILLVDDELSILNVLSVLLRAEGYEVSACDNGEKALALIRDAEFDLMISDIRMRPMDGMTLLKLALEHRPSLCVIMVTGYGSVETAVEALKLGAFDYVTKPFKLDELLITVKRALDYNRALSENAQMKAQMTGYNEFGNIVAESRSMRAVCDMIERVAPTATPVMICGERGTGKELVARTIHSRSQRKEGAFRVINCSAFPEALLETELFGNRPGEGAKTDDGQGKQGFAFSAGNTVFLKDVDTLPPGIQDRLADLLRDTHGRRAGETGAAKLDVRILTAISIPLEQLNEKQGFREDLYYRLNVINLHIPPLRERKDDIRLLASSFVQEFCQKYGKTELKISPGVMSLLLNYDWKGNIRELRNALEHAVILAENKVIQPEDLPEIIGGGISATEPLSDTDSISWAQARDAFGRHYIHNLLSKTGGNIQKASALADITRENLYKKCTKLGIDWRQYRKSSEYDNGGEI